MIRRISGGSTLKERKVDMNIQDDANYEAFKQIVEEHKKQKDQAEAFRREQAMFPPACNDEDELPHFPNFKLCPKCGLPAAVKECNVRDCNHMLGYVMQRLRVITHCEECKHTQKYRMAWMEVKNGEYVKKKAN